ncbi:MAG TPA: hypothetical protein PKL96_10220 [Bacteroidales bacterium]|nr:hypothetical protein [Bacteroidales bacterium]HPS27909.1 hypothetical protein [Bacteroidales bacterium]
MKNTYFVLILVIASVFLSSSCEKMVMEPNMPETYDGRQVKEEGTVYVSDKKVTLNIWAKNTSDNDIVTLVVNNKTEVSGFTLGGSSNKKELNLKLENDGYNYILLYINDTGNVTPTEAMITIDDGTGEQEITLTADLSYCGGAHIYVQ